MSSPLLFLVFSCCLALSSGSSCSYEGAAALRGDDVALNFDPKKMEGLWYEHAFADIAQLGASCQTLNGTYDEATGTLNTDFSVYYGPVPFTIVEHYEPHELSNSSMNGVYRKSVSAPFNIPGGHLVGLRTSIVKAEMLSEKDRYGLVVIYSCLAVVDELVIATRSPITKDSDIQAIMSELKTQGVPGANHLHRVDWSKCKTSETPAGTRSETVTLV